MAQGYNSVQLALREFLTKVFFEMYGYNPSLEQLYMMYLGAQQFMAFRKDFLG